MQLQNFLRWCFVLLTLSFVSGFFVAFWLDWDDPTHDAMDKTTDDTGWIDHAVISEWEITYVTDSTISYSNGQTVSKTVPFDV